MNDLKKKFYTLFVCVCVCRKSRRTEEKKKEKSLTALCYSTVRDVR